MKYDIVFEGGGAKGMAFAGALEELFQLKHTLGRALGTSAGAITATLLAAGYSPSEMLAALKEQKNGKSVFTEFMGEPEPFTSEEIKNSAICSFLNAIRVKIIPGWLEKRVDEAVAQALADNLRSRHFFSFVERGGWYAADRFLAWLGEKLDTGSWVGGRRRFSGMTLQQFYSATQIDLSMAASDATDGRLLVLNHRTAPNCPVVWAVRMSMSIPLIWNEVIWQSDWGNYLDKSIKGNVIVDGGLLSNFPIELFISAEPQVTRVMGPKQENPILGLLIDETIPVPTPTGRRGWVVDVDVKPGDLKTVQRLKRLIDTMTDAHDKMIVEEYENLVVRLPAKGYGTTEFDMTDARREALVEAGRVAVRNYFAPAPTTRRSAPAGAEQRKTAADRIATRILTR